jgi:hypothetical protein
MAVCGFGHIVQNRFNQTLEVRASREAQKSTRLSREFQSKQEG